MHDTVLIYVWGVPLHQEIEKRHRESQARFKICPDTMPHLLEMTNGGEHGQHRLHQHPHIPGPFFTHLEIGRIALGIVEAGIAEDDHLTVKLFNQSAEVLVVGIGGRTIPTYDVTQVVEHKRQFTST